MMVGCLGGLPLLWPSETGLIDRAAMINTNKTKHSTHIKCLMSKIHFSCGNGMVENALGMRKTPLGYTKQQSGVVLLVSLIMLLLLTLIGVSGSQVTGLEEKMAGNMKDRNLAFQAAEAALAAGEAATAGKPTITCPGAATGFYMPMDADCNGTAETTPVWESAAFDWATDSIQYTGDLKDISADPRYIIEDMGVVDCKGSATGSLGCRNYRVTARATGGTENAVVILQSIYQR